MKIINSDYIEQFLERTFKPHFIVLLLSIILEVSFPVQLIIQIMEGDINVSIEIKRIHKSPGTHSKAQNWNKNDIVRKPPIRNLLMWDSKRRLLL